MPISLTMHLSLMVFGSRSFVLCLGTTTNTKYLPPFHCSWLNSYASFATVLALTAPLQLVTTNNADQLHWGVGTHACPGRFFASYEIKLLMARILLNYDFKIYGMERPKDIATDIRVVPNPKAEVLFRNIKT